MSNPDKDDFGEIAAQWAARSISGDFSAKDRDALSRWLAADTRNADAFDEYIRIAENASDVADTIREDALVRELEQFAEDQTNRKSWWLAAPAMAASIAAAAVFFLQSAPQTGDDWRAYATGRGEAREIALADGSTISMNTDTAIRVLMSADSRLVELTKGEALFDVERDRERPFVVASANARTIVRGTRFNVEMNAGNTIVSVLSGVVEVDPTDFEHETLPVTLIAGHEVVVHADGEYDAVTAFNPDFVSAWRRGIERYENQRLEDVVNDLNRYFDAPIIVRDAGLAGLPVTGGFDVTNQALVVEALSAALSVRATNGPNGEIFLETDD